ncbi:MAG: hypothetical protein KDA28_02360, partial [Phycisphaerales bacterium]|nr:hypothetical protein [Phycisphaerales bacterium]
MHDQRDHALVTVAGQVHPMGLADVLTVASAALLESTPHGMGVCWGTIGHLVRRDVFLDLARFVRISEPPLPLWVKFVAWPETDRSSSGDTWGFGDFDLPDMEVRGAPES